MLDTGKRFEAIVSDFESALATLRDVVQHIKNSKSAPHLQVVMLNNTIVALTATIEEGLRGLFKEYLSVLEENFDDHRKLRISLQKANLDCAIQELRKCKKNADLKAATTIVASLHTCLGGLNNYRLLKDLITYNQANFRSYQVTEISKNVGIQGLWTDVCNCREVEEYLGEANLDSRVMRLTASWNNVFEERDLVVHRVSQASGWSADRIMQSFDLSKLVFNRIAARLLEDANSQICQAPVEPSSSQIAGGPGKVHRSLSCTLKSKLTKVWQSWRKLANHQ
jgi:RiboL-PSP-HEPN